MTEEATDLERWFTDYDKKVRAAAQRDVACWGTQVRIAPSLYVSSGLSGQRGENDGMPDRRPGIHLDRYV